jgi:phage terminase large subunit
LGKSLAIPRYALKQSEDLFKPAPLIGFSGGRGGAKSEDIATYLCEIANEIYSHPLKIVCGREMWNSIEDSCKSLIERKLEVMGIKNNFHITNKEIIHKVFGNKFMFKGLGKNVNSVKSIDGVSVLWIEEAQELTQGSIDVIDPSIRGEGAKIICSWNPQLPSDPVERWFNEMAPEGTIHHTVNWRDNVFFPNSLKIKKDKMKQVDRELYLHIYEGHYKSASNQCLFTLTEINESIERTPVFLDVPKVASLDVARFGDDSSVLAIKEGNHIPQIHEWNKLDTIQLANAVADIVMNEHIVAINVDNGGNAGGGVIDVLRRLVGHMCNVLEFRGADASTMDIYTNKRTESYYKLQKWMEKGKLVDNKMLIDDLSTVLFDFNSSGQRYLLPKDRQKKLLGRSPDCSDAVSQLFDPALRPKREKRQHIAQVGWDG